jgi:NADPH-dependent glutamate synthase beta subunit-like oxidoreductase
LRAIETRRRTGKWGWSERKTSEEELDMVAKREQEKNEKVAVSGDSGRGDAERAEGVGPAGKEEKEIDRWNEARRGGTE